MTFRSDLETLLASKSGGAASYDKSLALYGIKCLEGFDIAFNAPGASSGSGTTPDPDPPASITVPTGWTLAFEDNFTQPATFGQNALDGSKWGQRSYGGGPAHGGFDLVSWNDGAGLESTGSTIRIHTYRLSNGQFKCDGFQQGAQNVNPSGYAYHPGYGEFQVEVKFRYSTYNAKGVGAYGLMWPASNEWSSELDFFEMPGDQKNNLMSTMHWDSRGDYNLGGSNDQTSAFTSVDMTQYRVAVFRRTYTEDGSDTLGSVRGWIDGVEIANPGEWLSNSYLDENMVLGFAGFAAGGYNTGWYGAADNTSPADSYLEIEYARIWTPPDGGVVTPPTDTTITISPYSPGSRSVGAWNVTISAAVPLTWVVMNSDYSWTSASTNTTTSGSHSISPSFTASAQRLRVWETANPDNVVFSDPVTIV